MRPTIQNFTSVAILLLLGSSGLWAQSDLIRLEPKGSIDFRQEAATILFHPERPERMMIAIDGAYWQSAGGAVQMRASWKGKATTGSADRQGRWIVVGFEDGSLMRMDWSGQVLGTWRAHGKAVNSLEFAPLGRQVVSTGGDRHVALSDAEAGVVSSRLGEGEAKAFAYAGFSKGALSVIAVSREGQVFEWDMQTRREVRRFNLEENSVFGAAIDPAGRYLAILGQVARMAKGSLMSTAHPSNFYRDNRLAIYSLADWKEVKRLGNLDGEGLYPKFTSDGGYLVFVKRKVRGTSLAMFDLDRGVEIVDIPQANARAAGVHPNGDELMFAASEQTLSLQRIVGLRVGNRSGNLEGVKIRITSADRQPLLRKENGTIAVMDLNCGGIAKEVGAVASEMLRSRIVNSSIPVVALDRMNEIIRQQNFQLSDRTDASTAAQLGRILNARHIIYGTLGAIGTTYVITLHLIDVETARDLGAREAICQRCTLEDLPIVAAELETVLVGK